MTERTELKSCLPGDVVSCRRDPGSVIDTGFRYFLVVGRSVGVTQFGALSLLEFGVGRLLNVTDFHDQSVLNMVWRGEG